MDIIYIIKLIEKSLFTENGIYEELEINWVFTNDLATEYKKYCKKYGRNQRFNDVDYNGIVIPPNNISEPFNILINQRELDTFGKDYMLFCTVYHELVHAIDYYKYCKTFFDGDYNEMLNDEKYFAFFIWTEFNAKKKSYIFYRNYLPILFGGKEELLNIEVTKKNSDLELSLCSSNVDLIYVITHYLARYMRWEELYYDEFKNFKYVPDILKKIMGKNLKKFYTFFKKNKYLPLTKEKYNILFNIITDINLNITLYELNKIKNIKI